MDHQVRESIIASSHTGLSKFNRTHAPQLSPHLSLCKQLEDSILNQQPNNHAGSPYHSDSHPHALEMICRAKVDSQYDVHKNQQHTLQRQVEQLQGMNQKLRHDNQRLLEQCIRLRKTQLDWHNEFGIKVKSVPSGQKLELACRQLQLQKLQLQAQVNELAMSMVQMKHSKCFSCQIKISKVPFKQEIGKDIHQLKLVQQEIQTKLQALTHKYIPQSQHCVGSDKSMPQQYKQWEVDTTTATACHRDDDKEREKERQKERVKGRDNREHTKINIIEMLKSKYLNDPRI